MPAKILIVDDNIYLTQLLQAMLGDEGYEVEAERHAEGGYSAYLRNRPDVILTDIHMPGETGLEMVERIRQQDPYIQAVYMSGDWTYLQTAMREEKSPFFVKSLRKPFSRGELVKVLSEALSRAGVRHGKPAVKPSSPPLPCGD